MAKNDAILLDGILDDRVADGLPSKLRDEAFEFFAFEQLLRDADLSHDEILGGSVDGRDDGGIDGFFILVNGHPLNEPDSFMWPRSGSELELWIISCKHHETFRQAPLDNLVASISELFDLSVANDVLKGAYSEALLTKRTHLQLAYRKLSPRLNRFNISFIYVSRGDASIVGDSITSRSEQIVSLTRELFGNCKASFSFVGAAELIATHRRVRTFSIELPFLEALARGERYILLCKLSDLFKFVVDDQGRLRRYLFDSNVRAFMGLNPVNEDIRATLDTPDSPDFWWLNNGITILANKASVTGKSIQLEGVQIVNGLQTTESVFRFFIDGNNDPQERAVLIKIIVSTDASVRDAIIRATNNQTAVEIASLHATEKIQRDIEDVLLQHGIFYERRKNFYVNQGHPSTQIVDPLFLASGFVNLVLKSPSSATTLRSRFMRSNESYDRVFSAATPLLVWPSIVKILKRTDVVLETLRPLGKSTNTRFLKSWRQLTAFIATARLLGTFAYNANALAQIDHGAFTDELLRSSWDIIAANSGDKLKLRVSRQKKLVLDICQDVAGRFSIEAIQAVECQSITSHITKKPLTASFIERVNRTLPVQPWPPGVHHAVAKSLGCSSNDVYEATKLLVENGTRDYQKDGIVYGQDGKVVAIDEERLKNVDKQCRLTK